MEIIDQKLQRKPGNAGRLSGAYSKPFAKVTTFTMIQEIKLKNSKLKLHQSKSLFHSKGST